MSTEEMERKLFQHCSGMFLTECVPDDWDELTEEAQQAFTDEHGWDPLSGHPELLEIIGTAADSLKQFLLQEGLLDECEHVWVKVDHAVIRSGGFCSKCKAIQGKKAD